MASIINKKHLKALALDLAKQHRAQPFSRVSDSFLQRAEAALRGWMINEIKRLPSVGVTIK